jgi:DNA-binding CsgD family transcriptional regulator
MGMDREDRDHGPEEGQDAKLRGFSANVRALREVWLALGLGMAWLFTMVWTLTLFAYGRLGGSGRAVFDMSPPDPAMGLLMAATVLSQGLGCLWFTRAWDQETRAGTPVPRWLEPGAAVAVCLACLSLPWLSDAPLVAAQISIGLLSGWPVCRIFVNISRRVERDLRPLALCGGYALGIALHLGVSLVALDGVHPEKAPVANAAYMALLFAALAWAAARLDIANAPAPHPAVPNRPARPEFGISRFWPLILVSILCYPGLRVPEMMRHYIQAPLWPSVINRLACLAGVGLGLLLLRRLSKPSIFILGMACITLIPTFALARLLGLDWAGPWVAIIGAFGIFLIDITVQLLFIDAAHMTTRPALAACLGYITRMAVGLSYAVSGFPPFTEPYSWIIISLVFVSLSLPFIPKIFSYLKDMYQTTALFQAASPLPADPGPEQTPPAVADESAPPAGPSCPPEVAARLTPREVEIVTLCLLGLPSADIAGHLFIAESTLRNAFSRIYRKLGIRSRLQLMSLCLGPGPKESPASSEENILAPDLKAGDKGP